MKKKKKNIITIKIVTKKFNVKNKNINLLRNSKNYKWERTKILINKLKKDCKNI